MTSKQWACYSTLFGAVCVVSLLIPTTGCASSDPLQDDNILDTYRVSNHHHCQRLCWYRKLCVRYSFYNKNDNPGGSGDNCVLHWSNYEEKEKLLDGWTEEIASGDNLVRLINEREGGRRRGG